MTLPALRGLSVLTQAMHRSGVCSRICASYSRLTPATLVRKWREVSSICSDGLHALHEAGKRFELCPLVVGGAHGYIDVHAFLQSCHLAVLLQPGIPPVIANAGHSSKLVGRRIKYKKLLRLLTARQRDRAVRCPAPLTACPSPRKRHGRPGCTP